MLLSPLEGFVKHGEATHIRGLPLSAFTGRGGKSTTSCFPKNHIFIILGIMQPGEALQDPALQDNFQCFVC